MEPLWSEGLTLDDPDVDFANAPTPFMADNFDDLNDIESDDLLDLDMGQMDMGLVDNEVEVAISRARPPRAAAHDTGDCRPVL